VQPAEQSQGFKWEPSLRRARQALEGGSTEAAAALLDAVTNATRMAEHCYDVLFRRGTEELPERTFKDWSDFLFTLNKDSWNSYPEYSEKVTFDAVSDATQAALLTLQEMKGKPSRKSAVVRNLRKLVIELKAVHRQLRKLSEAREIPESSPGVESEAAAYVPLVGRIAAGGPILTDEDIVATFPLPRQLVGEGTLFLLRVTGDSMVEAAIVDGDWIVVRQQPEVENGEIVAAMIDGAVAVKTFKRSNGHVRLVSSNPVYPPIPAERAEIFGKVVAVLRRVRYER
jgi:SOS regulatory protein LexA